MYGNKIVLILNTLSFNQQIFMEQLLGTNGGVECWGRVESQTRHSVSLMKIRD